MSRRYPQALPDAYTRVTHYAGATPGWFRDQIALSRATHIVYHAELYGGYLAEALRSGAGKRPLIVNCHDLTFSRDGLVPDVYEPLLFEVADAFVFVTKQQAERARDLIAGKPYIVVPNYPSSSLFVDKTPLPHIGGLVYEGGLDKRGSAGAWRDLSPVADATDLHIYPANVDTDYGILHGMETDYRVLIHRLACHDWGLTGTPVPTQSWLEAFPNKVGDYWAAGIPFVALNTPILAEYAERGLGVLVDDMRVLRSLPDPKPFKKRVLAQRREFTIERHIDAYTRFIEGL